MYDVLSDPYPTSLGAVHLVFRQTLAEAFSNGYSASQEREGEIYCGCQKWNDRVMISVLFMCWTDLFHVDQGRFQNDLHNHMDCYQRRKLLNALI